jgi:hypothetical protein
MTRTSACREREVVKCCIPLQFLLGQSIINSVVNVTDVISTVKSSAGEEECQQNSFLGTSRQV